MVRIRLLLGGVAILGALAACGFGDRTGGVPVIVDYSPTVSDVGALVYLLSHPEVDVIAVTLPATGEAGCDLGVDITLGILALFDRGDIPVACDPDRPGHGEKWPAEFLTNGSALLTPLPDPIAKPDPRPAHEVIATVTREAADPVVLVAVAPLTNVARALEAHPDLVEHLDRIVVMGGAVDVAGNVPGTTAEWNLWIDAPAAAQVLAAPVAITLVPLDATNDVPTPPFWDLELARAPQTPMVSYLFATMRASPATTGGAFYLWDELAASVAAGEEFVTMEEISVVVDGASGDLGRTRRDPSGRTLAVAIGVEAPASFYTHFLDTIGGGSNGLLERSTFTEGGIPGSVDAGSPPRDVLAFWLAAALQGDSAAAGRVVAPDAPWAGFGAGHEVFVAGSAPYAVSSLEIDCAEEGELASCSARWSDSWIDANPALAEGVMRVSALVADGRITAFETVAFDPELVAAFNAHLAWLAAAHPDRYSTDCEPDADAVTCSELLADTVSQWVAER